MSKEEMVIKKMHQEKFVDIIDRPLRGLCKLPGR